MDRSVLIVDDEPTNLAVMKSILKQDYRLLFAKDGQKALELAESQMPDLVLLDVMMPDMDGFEVCTALKSSMLTKRIPVIFVTAMSDIEDEAKGFSLGAVDYISKPVSAPIVRARVEAQISLNRLKANLTEQVRVQVRQFERILRASIQMLGDAGHYNDTNTGVHIWRMAAYSRVLAEAAGWGEEDANLLEMAAPMHDTGKIAIPDAILKKPAKLTDDEWVVMKSHAEAGAEILGRSDTPLFLLAAEIAASHHERWDGTGYPQGLKGEAIPESGRIVAIADVFDALTMRRPYKEPWPVEKVVTAIEEGSGSHFDPDLVRLFQQSLPRLLEVKSHWDGKEAQQRAVEEQQKRRTKERRAEEQVNGSSNIETGGTDVPVSHVGQAVPV